MAGQVAEGWLGLWAALAGPAGTHFLILLQCAFSPGPVGLSGYLYRGSRFLHYLLPASGTCDGVVSDPDVLQLYCEYLLCYSADRYGAPLLFQR